MAQHRRLEVLSTSSETPAFQGVSKHPPGRPEHWPSARLVLHLRHAPLTFPAAQRSHWPLWSWKGPFSAANHVTMKLHGRHLHATFRHMLSCTCYILKKICPRTNLVKEMGIHCVEATCFLLHLWKQHLWLPIMDVCATPSPLQP